MKPALAIQQMDTAGLETETERETICDKVDLVHKVVYSLYTFTRPLMVLRMRLYVCMQINDFAASSVFLSSLDD